MDFFIYTLCSIIAIAILIDLVFLWLYKRFINKLIKKISKIGFILSIIAFFKNDRS